MAGHYIRDEVRLAPLARRVGGFALLLLPVSLLFHRLGAVDWDAFLLLLALVAVLALLAALTALGGLGKAWGIGARGGGVALAALLVSLAALSPFALAGLLAIENPLVAEAMTDEYGPAALAAAGGGASAAPTVAVTSGRRYDAAAPQVYAATRLVLGDNGWTVEDVTAGDPDAQARLANPDDLGRTTGEIPIPTPRSGVDMAIAADPLERPDSDQYRIEAVASDLLFARPSDVSIRIIEENGTTRVDLRSASRQGGFDLGQNRRFIDSFLAALDEAMTGAEAAIPSA
ncbi:DUF1499 domain-containing protein [Antarcticirhabdus aurantiaca]|uniref:DUF1499 domain-containing protein n=1 Tax=Antarcticirhabdus aurantiaca TaxID=2606717 RepID=A0ACD4NRY2_9HYPH|nr:DUF1499 domain-containing protein [Antarcticirhabdus aurantiaca]WAJ29655.1 DUF1499 domain-containing protein [Jeongeuplla avenae]